MNRPGSPTGCSPTRRPNARPAPSSPESSPATRGRSAADPDEPGRHQAPARAADDQRAQAQAGHPGRRDDHRRRLPGQDRDGLRDRRAVRGLLAGTPPPPPPPHHPQNLRQSPHARARGLEVTQTERRLDVAELDRCRYGTDEKINAWVEHLTGAGEQLRLMNAPAGMLAGGHMPEYLCQRTNGVVGLLERLIEDGCHEAIDSGRECLTEQLLDAIAISVAGSPGSDPDAGEIPGIPRQAGNRASQPPGKPNAGRTPRVRPPGPAPG